MKKLIFLLFSVALLATACSRPMTINLLQSYLQLAQQNPLTLQTLEKKLPATAHKTTQVAATTYHTFSKQNESLTLALLGDQVTSEAYYQLTTNAAQFRYETTGARPTFFFDTSNQKIATTLLTLLTTSTSTFSELYRNCLAISNDATMVDRLLAQLPLEPILANEVDDASPTVTTSFFDPDSQAEIQIERDRETAQLHRLILLEPDQQTEKTITFHNQTSATFTFASPLSDTTLINKILKIIAEAE